MEVEEMSLESKNVARYLVDRAAASGEAAAVQAARGGGHFERLSFAELNAQSDAVGHLLRSKGVRQGTRVLLLVKPGADLIRCCFALFKVGAVPVIIDPGMGLKSFLSCVRRSRPEALVGILPGHLIAGVFRSAFRSVQAKVVVGGGFERAYRRHLSDGEYPVFRAAADELAAVLFTSGSTGAPKGVCYGHGQFDAQVGLIRDTFGIEAGEVDMPMLPVFALFNPALGMCTVVPPMHPGKPAKADPAALVATMERFAVTNSFGSPVLWRKIGNFLQPSGRRVTTLKRVLMAGAPVPPRLFRQLREVLPGARLYSPYGATECLPVSYIEARTVLEETAEKTQRGSGTCVGNAVAGIRYRVIRWSELPIARITDAEELPAGEIGEIIATGPTVTRSYDRLPEATAKAKIADGEEVWHRMGDAGYTDAQGRLWFCGRMAERVVVGDKVWYTDCVEGWFSDIAGVARCALIALRRGAVVEPALVIEPERGAVPDEAAMRKLLDEEPMLTGIRRILKCRALPVDVRHNAKIHRLALAKRFGR
jgi:acyl-coenzyme A synthetase/AMP-(fatty) acid ligase